MFDDVSTDNSIPKLAKEDNVEADVVDSLLKAAGTEDHSRWLNDPNFINRHHGITSQEQMAMSVGDDWFDSGVTHDGKSVYMAARNEQQAAEMAQLLEEGRGTMSEPGFGPIRTLDDLMQAREYAASNDKDAGESSGLTDEATQGLPADFVERLRELTPEQMQILGNLLMEGGPADASPANNLTNWQDDEIGSVA